MNYIYKKLQDVGVSSVQDIIKIIIYAFFILPIVGFAMNSIGALPDKFTLPALTNHQKFAALYIVSYGFILGFLFSILIVGRQLGRWNTQQLTNRLETSIDSLSQLIQGTQLKAFPLSRPWHYIDYLTRASAGYAQSHSAGHLNEITLYGTMVGFSFLLPQPLADFIANSAARSFTLRLIASNCSTRLSTGTGNDELSIFPLYLVAQVVHKLALSSTGFFSLGRKDYTLRIQVCYLKRDMLSAAIHCRGVEAVTLQALDSDMFAKVVKGEQLQPGFRYHSSSDLNAFNRVEAVLDNVAGAFTTDGQNNAGLEKCEIWRLSRKRSANTLSIINPHWVLDNRNSSTQVTILSSANYAQRSNEQIDFQGANEIRKFIDALKSHLHSLTSINSMQQIVDEYSKNDWELSRQHVTGTLDATN